MNNPKIKHTTGFFLSLIAAMLWGMLPVALKELLAGMDAITIVWYRFLAAGVVLFAWLVIQRKLPQVLRQAVQINWFLLFAAVGLCINYFLFSYSLNFVYGETSKEIIAEAKQRFQELKHKDLDWKSFYNGYLEAKVKNFISDQELWK